MFVGGDYTIDPTFGVQRLSSAETTGIMNASEVSAAVAEEAWIHGPFQSVADLIYDANLRGVDEGAELTQEDINQRNESEFYSKFINIGKGTITEREYRSLYDAKQSEKLRQQAIARAPQTFTQGAKNFGVMLSVGMVDPLNIALGYLPLTLARAGYLGAKSASLAKNYAQSLEGMSALGRAGARAEVGAASGLVESAITEIPVYMAAQLRGEDYDAGDVLTSIMFGSVVGAGIHVGGGALYDVAFMPSKKARRENSAYKKQIAREKMTKIREFESSIESRSRNKEVIELLKRAYANADQFSVNQRFLARISAADRAALMQTNLATFLDGNNINVKPLLGLLEAKDWANRYRPEDVDLVYRDVIAEHLEAELDLKSITRVSPGMLNEFAQGTKVLRNEIATLQKALDKKITKGTTKKQRDALIKKQSRFDVLNQKLDDTRAAFKLRERYAKRIRDRVKQMREGNLPKDTLDLVNTEVARRVAVIDATHAPLDAAKLPGTNKLNAAIRSSLKETKQYIEAPSTARTFRPEAEAEMTLRGVSVTPKQSLSDVAQQAIDAEVNAKAVAEQMGIEYTSGAELDATLKQINDTKTARQALGLCMGKTA